MITLSSISLGSTGSALPVVPVPSLPQTGQTGRIYLVEDSGSYTLKVWNGTQYVSAGEAELTINDYQSRLQHLEENSVGSVAV